MKRRQQHHAFTLIELLVVISIIGLLAALALPSIRNFGKTNAISAANRQLLDDVAFARRRAISERTTVYMVFVPPNFWSDPGYGRLSIAPNEKQRADRLLPRQYSSYALLTLRGIGEQPGVQSPRYLSAWRTLPEGIFIAPQKFFGQTIKAVDPTDSTKVFLVSPFSYTDTLPFPSTDAAYVPPPPNPLKPYVRLPYLAFNYLGQLESGVDEFIPLTRGSIFYPQDANQQPLAQAADLVENPLGNSTNNYNLIHIDWLTGRARVEHQELK